MLPRVHSVIHSLWGFLLPSSARRGGKHWGLKFKQNFPHQQESSDCREQGCVTVPVECAPAHMGTSAYPGGGEGVWEQVKWELNLPNRPLPTRGFRKVF